MSILELRPFNASLVVQIVRPIHIRSSFDASLLLNLLKNIRGLLSKTTIQSSFKISSKTTKNIQ